VVYSVGVGEDISFDLRLMEQYQMPVHAFDPSPRSIEWIKTQDLPDGFYFYPFGLGPADGDVTFSEPVEEGYHSLSITGPANRSHHQGTTHVLPVRRLTTILQKLGHERLDLLKMDIEGAEYEVLVDLISSGVPVHQVLVEFHHRFRHIGVAKTREAIARMNRAGYKIFHVSSSGEEISFIQSGD
jgi:FkbM family methyltransferase